REAITHSQLDHPNVLPFLGLYHETAESPPLTIVPYIDGSSLLGLLAPAPSIDTGTFQRVLLDVTDGVNYLHSLLPPVIHGDLHPGNVLLNQEGKAYLCDFGLSRVRHEVSRTRTNRVNGGSTRFLAPELTDSPDAKFRTTSQSDIYSLAMLLFYMGTGERPFSQIELEWKVAVASVGGNRPEMPTSSRIVIPQMMKESFWSLLGKMWAHEPANRPTSGDVLKQVKGMMMLKA
ncbi:kinase-like protein, partial [Clavulina sp. PMI_390]